jgi:hypothetical protein
VSRDIFVQDIPSSARTVTDIPDGWLPGPLPFGRDAVVAAVTEIQPEADFADREWGHVAIPGVDIEVNVPDESPLTSFALHIRASDDAAAEVFVARLLTRLGVRAFDPEGAPESGIDGNG